MLARFCRVLLSATHASVTNEMQRKMQSWLNKIVPLTMHPKVEPQRLTLPHLSGNAFRTWAVISLGWKAVNCPLIADLIKLVSQSKLVPSAYFSVNS